MTQTDPTIDAVQAALDQCASEPVHIPGIIQPNGAIIAVDNESLKLTHASANLDDVIGMDATGVLGQSLYDVFPKGLRHDLVNNLLPAFLGQDTRLIEHITINDRTVFASAAAAGDETVFEFEPVRTDSAISTSAISQIAFLTAQLRGLDTRARLFDKTVQMLKVLTGYERVMIYAFDTDGNGQVVAEAVGGNMESLLNLNFPAWDIPEQARQIMRKTPLRYIGDVAATPVPVLAADGHSAPLNLTQSHLRGVSPVHMRYLSNMGTRASLTLNVSVAGDLWGMIALHHDQPTVPEPAVREVCRNFVRLFELSLESLLQHERLTRLKSAETLKKQLVAETASRRRQSMFDQSVLDDLCTAMRADGALLVKDGQAMTSGTVPSGARLNGFIDFANTVNDTLQTHQLGKTHPAAATQAGPDFAGLLLTPMRDNSFIAFFRRDRAREVTWAGNPDKEITGTGPDARLNPRGSFSAYKETVRGSADPWTMEQQQIAQDVWSILIHAERDALILQTTRQQKLVIDELNHRVRNMLTLIRSLSRQSRATTDTIEDFISTLEARIEAVATAHSLAVDQPDRFVSLIDLLRTAKQPYNVNAKRVHIRGEDAGLRPDITPMFALVVHELFTNAAKYGSLSQDTGRVDIDLRPVDGGALAIDWRESNGPPVAPPTRNGFGSTLLKNAVPQELGGTIDQHFDPDGFNAVLTLPGDILSKTRFVGARADMPSAEPAPPAKPSDASAMLSRSDLSCLLVEDSFVVSMDTVRIMHEVGLDKVQTALTVSEAEDLLSARLPDFAVLDVNLSAGHTSFGIARQLAARGTPFVFVTGYGKDGVPREAFPGVPVLAKPLRHAELEDALQGLAL